MFISSDVSELGFGFPSASSLLFASLQALGANARFGQGLEACSAASKSSVGDPQLRGKKWQTVFKGTSRNPETVNPRVDLYPESTGNPPPSLPSSQENESSPHKKAVRAFTARSFAPYSAGSVQLLQTSLRFGFQPRRFGIQGY